LPIALLADKLRATIGRPIGITWLTRRGWAVRERHGLGHRRPCGAERPETVRISVSLICLIADGGAGKPGARVGFLCAAKASEQMPEFYQLAVGWLLPRAARA